MKPAYLRATRPSPTTAPACLGCGVCPQCQAPRPGSTMVPSSAPLTPSVRGPMEHAFGIDFANVRVHADATAAAQAAQRGAAAFAQGNDIHFAAGRYAPDTTKGRHLLAHELAHVAQQRIPDGKVGDMTAEREAEGAAEHARRGEPVSVRRAGTGIQHQNSPHDRMIVERARRRLALLEQYEAQWQAREARRLRIRRERDQRLAERTALDRAAADSGADLVEGVAPGSREESERDLMAGLNRQPLTIDVSEDAVTFTVRFHIRFEDPAMSDRYTELTSALQQGLDLVWNQPLNSDVFSGRRMQVIAQNTPVAHDAPRDHRYWLITVRPTDSAPIEYPGCNLPQNDSGVPTSATDATCDGGVMSIPPRHITMGGVLGHELLHLLGLVDRYTNIVSVRPDGTRINENAPTRDTPDRLDPLGAEEGPVLREDLAFLFEHLGVYEMEANRALDVLTRLEGEGLSIGRVRGEMHRLREIIRLGYDPNSLIRPRRDFTDRLIRSAEDL
ncbi:eCIS core domain-containing protein [Halomonas kalidii]|uniref:eCIS core domain-containing protein n=1 Tax=Halomonas kalidii TaxID=3043293 RepID=UPI002DD65531|nr:DUF4157 domain-containing protein [Halomonas kalidii]